MIFTRSLKLIIALAFSLSLTTSYAWKEGHGGYSIDTPEGVFLLDFREAGIHLSPYYNQFISDSPVIQYYIEEYLVHPEFNETIKAKVIQKLSEIYAESADLSFAILSGLILYNFDFTPDPLIPTNDVNTVLQGFDDSDFIPTANRRQSTIKIHTDSWKLLDDDNKVGLLFHEILYSYTLPYHDKTLATLFDSSIASTRSRELTAYLFKKEFTPKGVHGFNAISNNSIKYKFSDKKLQFHKDMPVPNKGEMFLESKDKHIALVVTVKRPARKDFVYDWLTVPLKDWKEYKGKQVCSSIIENFQSVTGQVVLGVKQISKNSIQVKMNEMTNSSLEINRVDRVMATKDLFQDLHFVSESSCTYQLNRFVKELVTEEE
ncbi:MAG: hypothetical protein ACPGJV_02410 [Bacteriovoracaceae bacterium]